MELDGRNGIECNEVIFHYLDHLKTDGAELNGMNFISFHHLPATAIFLSLWFGRNEEFVLFRPKISNNGIKSSFRSVPLCYIPLCSAPFILWYPTVALVGLYLCSSELWIIRVFSIGIRVLRLKKWLCSFELVLAYLLELSVSIVLFSFQWFCCKGNFYLGLYTLGKLWFLEVLVLVLN